MLSDFYQLSEQEQYEYEREYNEYLDTLELDFPLPEDLNVLVEDLDLDNDSEEDDLFETYDEYTEDDEVISYDDLVDQDGFRELDFHD